MIVGHNSDFVHFIKVYVDHFPESDVFSQWLQFSPEQFVFQIQVQSWKSAKMENKLNQQETTKEIKLQIYKVLYFGKYYNLC